MRFLLLVLMLAPAQLAGQARDAAPHFEVFEASIRELQAAMAGRKVTAVQLVDAYLARIAAYDRGGARLNSVLRLNPRARVEAARLDSLRDAGTVFGPLHGIPILLKDNFSTRDAPTSGGSLALANHVPRDDAFQVRKLRAAGVVFLGKLNMHELASGITNISSLGGQTRNPYDPRRNPAGSSGGSGAAVAASLAAIAYGSDTCGSIRYPAAFQNLFGLRPTKGLSSITGIIPLSHTQDVGGPLARTVTDLAIGLDATIGPDPADSATRILEGRQLPAFEKALDTAALRGARLGVLTAYFGNQPDDQEVARVVRAAVAQMQRNGAEIVEVALPSIDSLVQRAGVINHEFKFDFIAYLEQTPDGKVRSIRDILDSGMYHVALEETFRNRDTVKLGESDGYRVALARRDSVRAAVVSLLEEQQLDAIVYPTVRRKPAMIGEPQRGGNCQLSAVSGLPALSAPAGFTPDGLPVGVELLGRPLSDARLVGLAYAYEQAVRPRRAPAATPPLVRGRAPAPYAFTLAGNAASKAQLRATFTLDPTRGELAYSVRVLGIPRERILAISLNRSVPERSGAMLFHLSGPQADRANGVLTLTGPEVEELVAGRVLLSVYTEDDSAGVIRAGLVPGAPVRAP